jgi:hypothetical protein
MSKLVYNKERSGKIIARGGPRDAQNRQRLDQQERMMRSSDDRGLRPQVVGSRGSSERPAQSSQIDLSQYMPFEEVRRKLVEVAEFTKKDESARFESGLNSLNEQLKESRRKYNAVQEELINSKAEIRRLKEEVMSSPNAGEFQKKLMEKEIELATVKAELSSKTTLVDMLNSILLSRTGEMQGLREKLDQVFDRISNGSITPLVGSHMDRPALEDKIFIDPIDSNREKQMDSHIEVREEKIVEENRNININAQAAKLRELLSR